MNDNRAVPAKSMTTVTLSASTPTTVGTNCPEVSAADTWPTREQLADQRRWLPMGVPAGTMRTDKANWLDVLDAHLEEIRASGVRWVIETVTSSGMYVTLLKRTVPKGFVEWLRKQDRDPSRLFIGTQDSCPAIRY